MNRVSRPAAFTLVELLVVIGIIAVLIGILLPSLSKARAQAKSTQCKATLRQYGVAWGNYAVANKGKVYHGTQNQGPYIVMYSAMYDTTTTPPSVNYNGGFLSPYMQKLEIVRNCPVVIDGASNVAGAISTPFDQMPQSYSYSPYVVNSNPKATGTGSSNKCVSLGKIRNAAETFWFGDGAILTSINSNRLSFPGFTNDFIDLPATQVGPSATYTAAAGNSTRLHGRHSGKANVLWFDGHVSDETPNYSNPYTNGTNTPDARKKLQIGDLLPGGVNFGDPMQNYYFWKDKSSQL